MKIITMTGMAFAGIATSFAELTMVSEALTFMSPAVNLYNLYFNLNMALAEAKAQAIRE